LVRGRIGEERCPLRLLFGIELEKLCVERTVKDGPL
jgi:hypothetical protein